MKITQHHSTSMETSSHSNTFHSLYSLGSRLGSGAFGTVYSAIRRSDGRRMAVKLVPVSHDSRSLRHEWETYTWINGSSSYHNNGVPRAYFFGQVLVKNEYFYALVIDRLGDSVQRVMEKRGSLSLEYTLSIGIQILEILRTIHENDYVHCDIKPDNMLFDISGRNLNVVDFGLSKPFRTYPEREHVKIRYGSKRKAVSMFASLNWHKRISMARRDDLECLGYSLVYLFKGKLPWENLDLQGTQDMKENFPLAKLCRGMSPSLLDYFLYVRGLRYEEDPDYDYLIDLMETHLEILEESSPDEVARNTHHLMKDRENRKHRTRKETHWRAKSGHHRKSRHMSRRSRHHVKYEHSSLDTNSSGPSRRPKRRSSRK